MKNETTKNGMCVKTSQKSLKADVCINTSKAVTTEQSISHFKASEAGVKTIYFIRHSKAKKEGSSDFDRDLSEKGKQNAEFMGKRLKKHKVLPDMIFASPAKRAIKSANLLARETKFKKDIIQVKDLYNASLENMLEFINSIDDKYNAIFIVGHNPSITQISELLSDSDIGNIPTGGIFCIKFDCCSFKDLKAHHGHALFFDYPKKHL